MTAQGSDALSSLRLRAAAAGALLAALALAGCASGPSVVAEAPQARNTGEFPNLNIVPEGETEQFTPSERAAKTRELAATRAASISQAGSLPPQRGDPAELRQLGATHAEETLKKIESGE